jgi:cytochrome P450
VTTPAQLPFDQASPLQPPQELRALQAQGPVHPVRTETGDPAWLVTGYQEVRQLLDDPRLGRSHPDPDRAARTGESALFGGPLGNYDTEAADHARMRALLQPHFTPRRIRALRARVEALTVALLDELARHGPPADLVEALAVPLPVLVICELLGVPYADRDRFRAWTRDAADVRDRTRSERGLAELFGYGQHLVARKRARPGDDVISRLCATPGTGDDEIAMLSMFLLFAGHETTVTAIGTGTLLLLTHPAQWQALTGDPALVPAAVEEMLRAGGQGGGGIPRYARTGLRIAGVPVQAGDLVLLDNGAANHDRTAFTDPERFEVTRSPVAHLSFGHGTRYCLGAPLARIELQVVFSMLVPRFPALRLAEPAGRLTFNRDTLTGGPARLPVTW